MLIKFQSEGAASFEMLQDHAGYLISLMGQSNRTEGAISGVALSEAMEKLHTALAEHSPPEEDSDDDEEEPAVSLSVRAMPLVEMLQHAKINDTYVMWQPS